MKCLNIYLRLLAIALATAGVKADRPDYVKIKTDMELKSRQVITNQKDMLKKIDATAEKVIREGEKALSEFKSNVTNLIPYLSQPTSEPFLNNIQEYINSKTSDRQEIIKIISETRRYQEKAANEFKESEKRYNKMLEYLTSSGDTEKNVKQGLSHYKSLGLTKERLVEINEKLVEFEPLVNDKVEKIDTYNKKLKVYRLLLDMVRHTRKIVTGSKRAYVDSFGTKDKILDGSNRMHSLSKRAKLIMGEAKSKELYKVELDKLNMLSDDLNQIREQMAALVKNTTKTMEHMQLTYSKAEGYEKSIIEEGKMNKSSLTKGYTKGKDIYVKLLKMKDATDEDVATLDQYKKETADLLKRGNELVHEMEGINKRKSKIIRKSLNLSTPHDLTSLVDLKEPLTDVSDSDESDAESVTSFDSDVSGYGSEEDTRTTKVIKTTETKSTKAPKNAKTTKKPTKTKDDKAYDDLDIERELELNESELKAKTKRMRTKKERDEMRNNAIASYLEDVETDDQGDSGTESSTPYSLPSSDDGKEKKKKKGLIRRGFSYLKKLALSPESLIDSMEEPVFSPSDDDTENLYDRRSPGDGASIGNRSSDREGYKTSARQENEKSENPEEPKLEDNEEYRRAIKESISLDLENKARKEMERLRRLGITDEKSRVDSDIYRLVELSYLLKKQFELVRDELKSSLSMNAVDVLKNTLKGLLHQHLSSVCSVALDLTRPNAFNLFSVRDGRINGVEAQRGAPAAGYYYRDVGKSSGYNTNNLGKVRPGYGNRMGPPFRVSRNMPGAHGRRFPEGRVLNRGSVRPAPGVPGFRPADFRAPSASPQFGTSAVPSAPPPPRTAEAATNTIAYSKPPPAVPQTRQTPPGADNPRPIAPGEQLNRSFVTSSPKPSDSSGFKMASEVGIGSVPQGYRPVNRLVGNREPGNTPGGTGLTTSSPAAGQALAKIPLWSDSDSESGLTTPGQRSKTVPLPLSVFVPAGGNSYQTEQLVPQTQAAQHQPSNDLDFFHSQPRQYEPGDVRNMPRLG